MEFSSEDYKGHKIELHYDEDPMSPRESDNGTMMICFHRDYTLGDEHAYKTEDYESYDDLLAAIKRDHEIVGPILPLWLYDQSGISMSAGARTYPYDCQWDSGQVGIIFMTKGGQEMVGTPDDHIEECLKGDVEVYDQYLRGEVYGYVIEGPEEDRVVTDSTGKELRRFTERETLDSCWGFFGDADYVMKEARSIVDNFAKEGTVSNA